MLTDHDGAMVGGGRQEAVAPRRTAHRVGRRDEALGALRDAVAWAGNDVERRHLVRRMERWQRD